MKRGEELRKREKEAEERANLVKRRKDKKKRLSQRAKQ